MASEEIHLNEVLEADGREVVETDLGEFIIQLAGETPSHIIAPAIHHDRYTVADLFADDAGHLVEADITAEAAYARARLRASFLGAGVGSVRRELRGGRHGVDLPGGERGQRPDVHVRAEGPHRHHGDGADRAGLVRAGPHARAAGPVRHGTGAVRLHQHHHRPAPRGRRGRSRGAPRRRARQRAVPDPRHRVPGGRCTASAAGPASTSARSTARSAATRTARSTPGPSARSSPRCCTRTIRRRASWPRPPRCAAPAGRCARSASRCTTCCCSCAGVTCRRDASRMRRVGFDAWSRLWSTRVGFRSSAAVGRIGPAAGQGPASPPGWAGAWTKGRELP